MNNMHLADLPPLSTSVLSSGTSISSGDNITIICFIIIKLQILQEPVKIHFKFYFKLWYLNFNTLGKGTFNHKNMVDFGVTSMTVIVWSLLPF